MKPTPNPKACSHAKRGGENQANQLSQNPLITRLVEEEREREVACKNLKTPQLICAPFSPENLSPSPDFKIQQEAQKESTQFEAKIRGKPPLFQAPELQCRRPRW